MAARTWYTKGVRRMSFTPFSSSEYLAAELHGLLVRIAGGLPRFRVRGGGRERQQAALGLSTGACIVRAHRDQAQEAYLQLRCLLRRWVQVAGQGHLVLVDCLRVVACLVQTHCLVEGVSRATAADR